MLTLIMRCHNRIEYTLRALNALARQQHAPDFEVLIVDNASSDGTAQALAWLQANEGTALWFPPMRVLSPGANLGDWGGMQHAREHLHERTQLVGQVDNDIVLPPLALAVCSSLVASGRAGVAMLKRHGYRQAILPTVSRATHVNVRGFSAQYVPVDHAVSFWITTREAFDEYAPAASNCKACTNAIDGVVKVLNLHCTQVEGYGQDGADSYVQADKYPRSGQR